MKIVAGLKGVCALCAVAHASSVPDKVERWAQYEFSLTSSCSGNPFTDVELTATFRQSETDKEVVVRGFYDGGETYRVRFAPPEEGTWTYTTASNSDRLAGHSGTLEVQAPSAGNHGPVGPDGFALRYADGTSYFSVGTTSYQWASKGFDMQKQTLQTLKEGQGNGPIFNKMRMTVFPKWYVYNHANPVETGAPYEIIPESPASDPANWFCKGEHCPALDGSFDLQRFNVSYWQNYEHLLREMQSMGVIADIIVFHPYDEGHWGFDCMGGRDKETYDTTHDKFYLQYLGARLSSFSNVWWSMANEWDGWNPNNCKAKDVQEDDGPSPTWDELFMALGAADPHGRMTGIHNGKYLYNHSQPWITHVSIQGLEDRTPALRTKYGKPLIWDEVRYEGDIPCCSWGALSGAEMADRYWWGASLGVYVGHSETVLHPDIAEDDDQPLWWAKGGELVGTSPERIRWFRSLWEDSAARPDFTSLAPSTESFGNSGGDVANMMSTPGAFYSMRFLRAGEWDIPLAPAEGDMADRMWEVRSLDYWDMTQTVIAQLPADASTFKVLVKSTPYNVEIARAPLGAAIMM